MLSFFRINDPYRLVGVFLVLIILRLPYWIFGIDMTVSQLTWNIVATKLSDGAVMYRDVWSTLSPLSAGVYWILHEIAGNSAFLTQVLSVILVFFQSAVFNSIMINKGALSENTYIPAAVYVIIASLHFDFFLLSPVMMGATFLLLAINNVFGQIEIRAKRDETLLNTGIFLGLAALFHFPFIFLGPIFLLVLLLFTATVRRRYFLFLFGWVLPLILVGLYYFYHDSFHWFWKNEVESWFLIDSNEYITKQNALVFVGFVLLLMILSAARIFRKARMTNYQGRLLQAILIIMIMSTLILFIEVDRNAYVLLAFLVPSAFLISHFFTLTRRGVGGEATFLIFILTAALINYWSISNSNKEGLFDMRSYFITETTLDYKDKKVAWLGDNVSIYQHSYPATPFIDWRLAQNTWQNFRQVKNLTLIASSIEKENPEIIIDPDNRMPALLEYAPGLRRKYLKKGQVYSLIISN